MHSTPSLYLHKTRLILFSNLHLYLPTELFPLDLIASALYVNHHLPLYVTSTAHITLDFITLLTGEMQTL
jgi:hypothetical protein